MIHKYRVWDGKNMFYIAHFLDYYDYGNKNKIFMQFTGRFDINGTEIYQSDYTVNSKGHEEIVEWHNSAWVLRSFHPRYKGWEYLADKVIEVIGNVHEHPELMEKSCKG